MEVLASGLPFGHGVPEAVDATLVSAIHANGEPYARADVVPGVALRRAGERKRDNYPELVDSSVFVLGHRGSRDRRQVQRDSEETSGRGRRSKGPQSPSCTSAFGGASLASSLDNYAVDVRANGSGRNLG